MNLFSKLEAFQGILPRIFVYATNIISHMIESEFFIFVSAKRFSALSIFDSYKVLYRFVADKHRFDVFEIADRVRFGA